MNKAFLFDMDGVIVDSEKAWEIYEPPLLEKLFGRKVVDSLDKKTGLGIQGVHDAVREFGFSITLQELSREYERITPDVYGHSPITKGVEQLGHKLIELGFRLGVVTNSPRSWINRVVPRLSFYNRLEAIVSIPELPELKRKPAPDGFLEAFRITDADPKRSFILEDSNPGIAAGKASGAYTIGFRGCLVEDYEQTGADEYADSMEDVTRIVENKI